MSRLLLATSSILKTLFSPTERYDIDIGLNYAEMCCSAVHAQSSRTNVKSNDDAIA
jgi:hypothetical protein